MNEHGGDMTTLFGPIDCFHYLDEEPKVVIETFRGDRVDFLEITSAGSIHLYHYFKKDAYRVNLTHTHPS